MKVISVINQKGGVGKTTTVINLGASLALLNKKTLIVDLDPQGNMTAGLNLPRDLLKQKSTYFSLAEEGRLIDNAIPTTLEKLMAVGADSNLAGAEVELVSVVGREFRLKESISSGLEDYDYVLIDCPPSLGLLTVNALSASNSYLIPMQAEFFSMQGLTSIMKTANIVKKHLNANLDLEGILLTMFDSRSNLSKQVMNEVKEFVGEKLFKTLVPRRIRLSESTSHGIPGVVYDPTCLGSRAYMNVAREVIFNHTGEEMELEPEQPFLPPDPMDRFAKVQKPIELPPIQPLTQTKQNEGAN
ncbi:MAG: ParA family protein [Bdellovibrionota bacterium]